LIGYFCRFFLKIISSTVAAATAMIIMGAMGKSRTLALLVQTILSPLKQSLNLNS
jgi:hypothetical protein